ncbi:phage tail protein [Bowmanella denitrificans]|uniref:phage tail-collar fiber domain-containing protein n=1 Tax=Bowmanella denitrificans TaxID=366582 RepID=UPI000C99CEFD|nr:phage tail protein [Bowmanella denitrificans]
MSHSGKLTAAGHALIGAKISADENLNISTFKFANVAGLDPETLPENYSETEPSADLVHTMPVTRAGAIDGDTVVYSAVLDSTVGDFEFNWVGLYDDTDTLVMIRYTYPQQKLGTPFGGGNNLTRNFALKFVGAADVTNVTIPAESWQFDVSAYVFERLDWTEINTNTVAKEGHRYRLMQPLTLTIPQGLTKSIYVVCDAQSGMGIASPGYLQVATGIIRTRRGNYSQVQLTRRELTWRIDFVNGVPTL